MRSGPTRGRLHAQTDERRSDGQGYGPDDVVHSAAARTSAGDVDAQPSYRVQVWDPRRSRSSTARRCTTYPEAKTWRDDVRIAVRDGHDPARANRRVGRGGAALLEGMKDGSLLDRSGKTYKPSTCRSYALAVTKYLKPDPIARMRVTAVRRADVQDYVDRLRRKGMSASTIANKLDPVRVVFRRAIKRRAEITVDPTKDLELPAIRGRRDRIADRTEAAALIDALPDCGDGVLGDRDLRRPAPGRAPGAAMVRRRARCPTGGDPRPTHLGRRRRRGRGQDRRRVPRGSGHRRTAAAPGRSSRYDQPKRRATSSSVAPPPTRSFPPPSEAARYEPGAGRRVANPESDRPKTIWVKARPDALEPIAPHEGRHSAASYLIEAGLNDLELTATIGHSDSRTTKRIYGHLFPDSSATIAAKLDAYHATGITDGAF